MKARTVRYMEGRKAVKAAQRLVTAKRQPEPAQKVAEAIRARQRVLDRLAESYRNLGHSLTKKSLAIRGHFYNQN